MSLAIYELTEARDWNRHNSPGAVIVDSVTGTPLPLPLFPDTDCARHFLMWAERDEVEPFGPSKVYDPAKLRMSFSLWWNAYMDEDGEYLTNTAQAEVDANG